MLTIRRVVTSAFNNSLRNLLNLQIVPTDPVCPEPALRTEPEQIGEIRKQEDSCLYDSSDVPDWEDLHRRRFFRLVYINPIPIPFRHNADIVRIGRGEYSGQSVIAKCKTAAPLFPV